MDLEPRPLRRDERLRQRRREERAAEERRKLARRLLRGLGRPTYQALIEALVERRKARGLTQQELDDKIGCAGGLVGKWECLSRGASLVSLVMWAEALGCEIALSTTAVPVPLDNTKTLLDAIAAQRCSLRLVGGGETANGPTIPKLPVR